MWKIQQTNTQPKPSIDAGGCEQRAKCTVSGNLSGVFLFLRLIRQRFATRYMGTFEFIGFQQNSHRKKDQKQKKQSSWSASCLQNDLCLAEEAVREPALPLQVMSFQRVSHWCRCSAHQPRELQGGFQAPEATKRWLSTSGSAQAEVEHVGAFLHLLLHVLTLSTQTRSAVFHQNFYVRWRLHDISKIRAPGGPGARTHSGVPRGGLKLKLYSSGYWFKKKKTLKTWKKDSSLQYLPSVRRGHWSHTVNIE